MKLAKSLLLGSSAVFVAAAGAQAADLPSRKAAPVQYVRVCDVYGAGFFYIPGTNTCLRVGGYVRVQATYSPGHNVISASNGAVTQVGSDQDQTGLEVRGTVTLDARTQSDYGTVQTFARLRAADEDGVRAPGGEANFQTEIAPAGTKSTGITLERAFIRFAGLTAGRASENANTIPGYLYGAHTYASFANGVKQLAYTATFGGGLSSTIAIESAGDFGYSSVSGTPVSISAVPTGANSEYVNQWDTGYVLVNNIRLDQSWGYVQLASELTNDSATCYDGICTSKNQPLQGPHRYGAWGLVGSFGVKLPMIAPGDAFHFEASYGDGWLGAVLNNVGLNVISTATQHRWLGGVQRVDSNLVPTNVTSSGAIESYGLTTAWDVYGLFTHYWTPRWRSNFGAGYADITPPTANCADVSGGVCSQDSGLNTQWGEGQAYIANAQLIWSPVKNFDIGLEVDYLHIQSKLQNPSETFVKAGEPGLTEDGFEYHLRLERTF